MSENIRLAKNAIFLYGRSLITMVVGIVSVRLLLQALGVDDYGLLNVAGSLVGVFSFIITGVSIGVSRFMTFEFGRGDIERMRRTFSSSLIAFTAINIVVVILLETAGLWYLHNYLVVPEGKETEAFWVYQASVLYVVVILFRVPYGAVFLSHEKFDMLAIIEVSNALLRLGMILYIGTIPDNQRLVAFAFLQSSLPVLHLIIYYLYTRRFPETHFRLTFHKSIFTPILHFSLWEMIGSVSRMLKSSGFNMIVNFFCGVVMNATIGIANTVSGAVTSLSFTLSSVFFPGLVKAYARKDMEEFSTLAYRASLGSMLLFGMLAMPLACECTYVLTLWLGTPPELTPEMCLIFLVANTVLMAELVGAESIRAAGKNRALNILQCISAAVLIGLVFAVFYSGMSVLIGCIVFSLDALLSLGIVLVLMAEEFGLSMASRYLRGSVVRVLFVNLAVYLLIRIFSESMEPSFLRLVISCLISVISFTLLSFIFLLTKDERSALTSYVRLRLNPSETSA